MKKMFLMALAATTVFVSCNKDEIENLEIRNAHLTAVNEGLSSEILSIQTELTASNEANAQLTIQLETANDELVTITASLEASDADSAEKAENIANLLAEIASLQALIDTANADLSANMEEIAGLESQLDDANADLDDVKARLATALANQTIVVEEVTVVEQVINEVVETITETVEVEVPTGITQAQLDELQAQLDAALASSGTSSATQAELDAAIAARDAAQLALDAITPEDGISQADVDAVQALLDAANARIIVLEAEVAALTNAVTVYFTNDDSPLGDGSEERYYDSIDLAHERIEQEHNSGTIYTIWEATRTGVAETGFFFSAGSNPQIFITEVSGYRSYTPVVDADDDGFNADVDLDDNDASIGDQAFEDLKAEAAAQQEAQRLADGLADAPWTPAFTNQTADFTQTKSFETLNDSRVVVVTTSGGGTTNGTSDEATEGDQNGDGDTLDTLTRVITADTVYTASIGGTRTVKGSNGDWTIVTDNDPPAVTTGTVNLVNGGQDAFASSGFEGIYVDGVENTTGSFVATVGTPYVITIRNNFTNVIQATLTVTPSASDFDNAAVITVTYDKDANSLSN